MSSSAVAFVDWHRPATNARNCPRLKAPQAGRASAERFESGIETTKRFLRDRVDLPTPL